MEGPIHIWNGIFQTITILLLTICDQNFIHSMNTRIMQLGKFKKFKCLNCLIPAH